MATSTRIGDMHKIVMLNFMKENPELAFGRMKNSNSQTKSKLMDLRDAFTAAVNAVGGLNCVPKTPEKAMKSWNDWKGIILGKKAKIIAHAKGTGGGKPLDIHLTQIEEELLDFLGPDSFGIPEIQEGGFKIPKKFMSRKSRSETSINSQEHISHHNITFSSTFRPSDISSCTPGMSPSNNLTSMKGQPGRMNTPSTRFNQYSVIPAANLTSAQTQTGRISTPRSTFNHSAGLPHAIVRSKEGQLGGMSTLRRTVNQSSLLPVATGTSNQRQVSGMIDPRSFFNQSPAEMPRSTSLEQSDETGTRSTNSSPSAPLSKRSFGCSTKKTPIYARYTENTSTSNMKFQSSSAGLQYTRNLIQRNTSNNSTLPSLSTSPTIYNSAEYQLESADSFDQPTPFEDNDYILLGSLDENDNKDEEFPAFNGNGYIPEEGEQQEINPMEYMGSSPSETHFNGEDHIDTERPAKKQRVVEPIDESMESMQPKIENAREDFEARRLHGEAKYALKLKIFAFEKETMQIEGGRHDELLSIMREMNENVTQLLQQLSLKSDNNDR